MWNATIWYTGTNSLFLDDPVFAAPRIIYPLNAIFVPVFQTESNRGYDSTKHFIDLCLLISHRLSLRSTLQKSSSTEGPFEEM